MGATRTVEELEVDPEGVTVSSHPDREPAIHLVEEEGALALVTFGDTDRLTRSRWHEHLRLEPCCRDVSRLGDLRRKNAFFDEKHVGVKTRTLVTGHHLTNGAVHGHDLATRQDTLQRNHVIELDELTGGHADPELEGCCIFGPEDPSDHLFHLHRE